MESVYEIIDSDEYKALHRRMIIAAFLKAVDSASTREEIENCDVLNKIADAVIETDAFPGTMLLTFPSIVDAHRLLDTCGHDVAVTIDYESYEHAVVEEIVFNFADKCYVYNEFGFKDKSDEPAVETKELSVTHKFKDVVLLTGAVIVSLGTFIRKESRLFMGIKNDVLYGIRFDDSQMLVTGIESTNDEVQGTAYVTVRFPDSILETFPESMIVTEYDFDPIEVLKSVYGPNVE